MADVVTLGHEPDPAKRLRQRWGSKIAQTRALRELSRADVADRVGVSEQAVGMWERGETAPRWHHQLAIADALDVPHGVLFPMEGAA